MSSPATISAPTQTDHPFPSSNPDSRRRRRPRGARRGNNTNPESASPQTVQEESTSTHQEHQERQLQANASLALRPASVAPAESSTSQQNHNIRNQGAENSRAERGGRRGRGRGRGKDNAATSVVTGRAFGGALTSEPLQDGLAEFSPTTTLQAGATEFIPGQHQTHLHSRERQKPQPKQKRRLSKSSAPDIATRVHEDIDNRQYECPICTSEVLRKSKIWSCHMCWTVFHLDCIKKWAANTDALHQQQGDQSSSQTSLWRCPGCNLPQDTKPSTYTCWCGKDQDPRSITGLPPHSCGQTCGKPRLLPKKCPHPCELLCHAGPCPPCTHMGPKQSCFCGKNSATQRCVETDYENGWSCGDPCADIMPCGEHPCPRVCHEGLCGACEVRIPGRCYCGKEEKDLLCCDKDNDESCRRTYLDKSSEQITETWTGIFQCPNSCERYFDCGRHQCQKPCHPSDINLSHCPRSPDIASHCPCGKTPLQELSSEPRSSCEASIPHCSKLCQRKLQCDHQCQQKCHSGICMPCLQNVTISCRCGKTTVSTICHQGSEAKPMCTKVCHTTLNCGRHECGERCCPGERKAVERQSVKKKGRPLNSSSRPLDDGFEAEHICTRVCGRTLKCGNHACQELCHKGPCGSCREAIFDDLSCHCGRTVIQAPLPCGTKPPPCRYECERPKSCGHPQVAHNCHSDEEACPKCPFLTEKVCCCGKKTLKNQQCWVTDPHCGEVCGKKLKCGTHYCKKTCHRLGECEDQGQACQQMCGKEKKVCGHPCEDTCHAPYACREDKPCTHKIFITCICQHKKLETKCNACRTSEGNKVKSLPCDDECARLERNRKLALALNVAEDHQDDHIPYSRETLKLYQENVHWSQEQEREFRLFAFSEDEKRLRFKPMSSAQRAFLHSLAEDYGLDSESMDPEPHRHVAVFKTPRFVSPPKKTIRDCVRIRQNQVSAAASAAESKARTKASNYIEPYNGCILTNARFALTIDELHSEIMAVQGPNPKVQFHVEFKAGDVVALKALLQNHTERTIDLNLKELKSPLARAFNSHGFGNLHLCRFDDHLNVVRDEYESANEGGWSQVAAKAAAPRRPPATPSVGENSSFTILGSLKKKPQLTPGKKSPHESIVDDWETAEDIAEASPEPAV